ncbi:MAG TPA: hypothetical protein VFW25_12940 [Silvibacterium sp.]|nr:hypothetical protein [Silvibacterium sp.]
MNRLRLYSAALATAAFISIGSLSALPQKVSTPAKRPCAGLHCALVVVDQVSSAGPKGELKYITASGKTATYILSCLASQCQAPIEGSKYEYSEQPENDAAGDRYAFLTGSGLNHEQYSLEVIIPQQSAPEVQKLIAACRSSDQSADEVACGKWVRRKLAIQKMACPDSSAATACNSFKELVRASDAKVMYDLTHSDHVYACFVPDKDEFFEVAFSEPASSGFAPPSAEQINEGVPPNALAIGGASRFAYYKDGVEDEKMSLHDIGNWIYFARGDKRDPQSTQQNATTKRAEFKGKNIGIEGDRWTLSVTYRNQADSETTHTVTLQLATGRFEQSFALAGTGDGDGEPGRFIIAPSDYFSLP